MCTTIEDEFNIHQFRDILSPEKELVVLTRLNEKEIKNSQIKIHNLVVKYYCQYLACI